MRINDRKTSAHADMFFENRSVGEWLTCSEAADFLRITPNALRILVSRDRVKAYRIGRRLRFNTVDLRRLLFKGV